MNAALHALVLVCHSPKQRNSAPSFVCVVTKSMVFQQKTRHPPSETVRAKRVSNHVGVNGLKTLGRWLRCHGEGTSKCELRAVFSSVTDFRELMPRTHKQRVILGRIEALSTNGQREEIPVHCAPMALDAQASGPLSRPARQRLPVGVAPICGRARRSCP
jgi:hypothetical protein